MANNRNEELAREVRQTYEKLLRPFAREDCRALLSQNDQRFDNFVPDLALYFSMVAGYGSWGGRILNWDEEQVNLANHDLRRSFFQAHPEYKDLEAQITESATPLLYAELVDHEHVRGLLLELIAALPVQRTGRSSLQEVA